MCDLEGEFAAIVARLRAMSLPAPPAGAKARGLKQIMDAYASGRLEQLAEADVRGT